MDMGASLIPSPPRTAELLSMVCQPGDRRWGPWLASSSAQGGEVVLAHLGFCRQPAGCQTVSELRSKHSTTPLADGLKLQRC